MNERMMTRRTGKAISATLLAVVPSASDASVSYEIKQSNRDGVVYCSCPSWKYDMDGKRLVGYARPSKDRSCKHTRAYAAGLLTPPTVGRVETMAPKATEDCSTEDCSVIKSVEVAGLRKTASYMVKKGAKPEAIITVLKEGGLSDLGAWSLLREVDA